MEAISLFTSSNKNLFLRTLFYENTIGLHIDGDGPNDSPDGIDDSGGNQFFDTLFAMNGTDINLTAGTNPNNLSGKIYFDSLSASCTGDPSDAIDTGCSLGASSTGSLESALDFLLTPLFTPTGVFATDESTLNTNLNQTHATSYLVWGDEDNFGFNDLSITFEIFDLRPDHVAYNGLPSTGGPPISHNFNLGSVNFDAGKREMMAADRYNLANPVASWNDNGLCEAGEDCIITPNMGAYQGSGSEFVYDSANLFSFPFLLSE